MAIKQKKYCRFIKNKQTKQSTVLRRFLPRIGHQPLPYKVPSSLAQTAVEQPQGGIHPRETKSGSWLCQTDSFLRQMCCEPQNYEAGTQLAQTRLTHQSQGLWGRLKPKLSLVILAFECVSCFLQ